MIKHLPIVAGLVAVLLASRTISAYTIDPASGALAAQSGSPFPTGSLPSAIAISD